MTSDWIVAKFKGIFGESKTLKIKVTGWNMFNPLRLLIYLIPVGLVLLVSLILIWLLRFMFSKYTLKM